MITFQPLTQWPGERTKAKQSCQFRSGYDSTLAALKYELARLDAKNVILLADCDPRDIRRDGLLRGDARLRSSGIVLTFDCKHGALSYPCDTYYNWQDNLRAIALALEHLRAVDRYGVTRRGEQYTGWARLPAPAAADGFRTVDEAWVWLCDQLAPSSAREGLPRVRLTQENYDQAWRAAAKKLHPDVQGGVTAGFQKLQQARQLLEKYFEAHQGHPI